MRNPRSKGEKKESSCIDREGQQIEVHALPFLCAMSHLEMQGWAPQCSAEKPASREFISSLLC